MNGAMRYDDGSLSDALEDEPHQTEASRYPGEV